MCECLFKFKKIEQFFKSVDQVMTEEIKISEIDIKRQEDER